VAQKSEVPWLGFEGCEAHVLRTGSHPHIVLRELPPSAVQSGNSRKMRVGANSIPTPEGLLAPLDSG
jgi:hypothetical protein